MVQEGLIFETSSLEATINTVYFKYVIAVGS